jgi:hypothetical protein
MRKYNAATITARRAQRSTGFAVTRIMGLVLLLGLAASTLAGCVVVPVGGYGYERHSYYAHPYHHHYYYYYRG